MRQLLLLNSVTEALRTEDRHPRTHNTTLVDGFIPQGTSHLWERLLEGAYE